MYRACFLTLRGWRYENGAWRKLGESHRIRNWVHGGEVETDEFDLGQAWDRESNR